MLVGPESDQYARIQSLAEVLGDIGIDARAMGRVAFSGW
jgi:hypothetical protein